MGGKSGDHVSARRMQNAYRASWADLGGARPVTAHKRRSAPSSKLHAQACPSFFQAEDILYQVHLRRSGLSAPS